MSDECPTCGKKLNWVCGVTECDCGYSDILSPCVCCNDRRKECPGKQKCDDYQNWLKYCKVHRND